MGPHGGSFRMSSSSRTQGLDALLEPRSVAVVGASRSPDAIGRRIFENLLEADLEGPVHPVNPKARSVGGVRAYAAVEEVPDEVDLAVIAVPAEHVPHVVEGCGRAGVRAIVVITAGFREVGGEGVQREAELRELADRYGLRVVGPNCMGVLNTDPNVRMNATFSPAHVRRGGLAFVSQSGALGLAILDTAQELGLGLSHFVSLGNRMDVSSNDLMEAWSHDPNVDAILLYLEHFGNPRNFIDVAREVTPRKPVLAVKSGRSAAGARAARSHTGALAEEDALTDALLEQCGVLRVDTIEEMFAHARVFARAPVPPGNRVAILTNSGGPGIMATDALERHGLELASLTEATRERLAEVAPHEASISNPVDLTAGAGPAEYEASLEAILSDPHVDDVLVIYTPPTFIRDEQVVEALLTPERGGKPVLACVLGRRQGDTAFHQLTEAGLPTFTFPESAIQALGAYVSWGELRNRPLGTVPDLPGIQPEVADDIVAQALDRGDEWLPPGEAFDLLAAYGIPAAPPARATTPEEAAALVEEAAGSSVLKGYAPSLVHKSDVGAVVPDVVEAADAELAFRSIEAAVEAAGHELESVMVQDQVPAGREVIMGSTADPVFGPTVLFGLGGTHVEVLRDVVVRLAPLRDHEAARMVRAIRAWPLLEGVRGERHADVNALEDMLLRISQLARDRPEVREMDLNPIIVGDAGEGAVCVDARIRLWPGGEPPRPSGRGAQRT